MQVRPYLYFDGRCEEAIEFYKTAIGAKVSMLMRFGQSPVPIPPERLEPGSENKVMHATLFVGDSIINLSDGSSRGNPVFKRHRSHPRRSHRTRGKKYFQQPVRRRQSKHATG